MRIEKSELLDLEEVEYSERELERLFKKFNERGLEVGLMGGWAVHLLLLSKGRTHIGSRDIDIFFDPKTTKPADLLTTAEENFAPHSTFRWAMFVDKTTGKRVSEEMSKSIPAYNLFTVYLDIFASEKTDTPVFCEPLLKPVFEKGEKMEIEFKDLRITIPSPKRLILMKLKSVLERQDEFKQVKDIIDLFALISQFPQALEEVPENLESRVLVRKRLPVFVRDGIVSKASVNLGVGMSLVEEVLKRL